MSAICRIGISLLCGAVVNDVLLVDGNSWTALAKLMTLAGIVLIAFDGFTFRALSKTDAVTALYVVGLVVISMYAPTSYHSPGWSMVAAALLVGGAGHAVFA